MGGGHGPGRRLDRSRSSTALAELQRQGLIKHLGLSNVTSAQVAEARKIAEVVCVQNLYNIVHRGDDALIDELAGHGHRLCALFPARRLLAAAVGGAVQVAAELGATPMQVALAWLLRRAPNILLIPGTSSLAHLRENLAAAAVVLPDTVMARLDRIGAPAATVG